MDSIRINAGVKKIAINDDPERIITFNPTDIGFAERFYALIQDFEGKQTEYQKRAVEIDGNQTLDENGLPTNMTERLEFVREVCEYMHAGIDKLFGAGTSQAAFEGALSLEMVGEFFEGITPFVQQARQTKLTRYTRPAQTKKGAVLK